MGPKTGLIGVIVACILSIALSIFSIIDLDDSQAELTYKTMWRGGQAFLTLVKTGVWFYVWLMIFKDKKSVLYTNQAYQKSIFAFAITSGIHCVANILNCFVPYGKGDWVKVVKTIIEILNITLSSFDLILGFGLFWAELQGKSFDQIQAKDKLFEIISKIKSFGKDHNDQVRGNEQARMQQQADMINNPLQTPSDKAFGKRQKRRNPSKRRKKK
mgnify:CR=1 FL=1|tara:strand:+ start:356 stop:1000 length:645 start_codon:yes stop_codon:yes gene_type:complete